MIYKWIRQNKIGKSAEGPDTVGEKTNQLKREESTWKTIRPKQLRRSTKRG